MKIRPSYGVPRNIRTTTYALAAASMLIVMIGLQLFTYEDFAIVLSGLLPATDKRLLTVIAGSVVLAELFSLLYLLGMYVSKLMRIVSASLAFGVSGFWLFLCLTNAHAVNSGIFSSSVELTGGLLAAGWSAILFSLVCKIIFVDSRFRHATS